MQTHNEMITLLDQLTPTNYNIIKELIEYTITSQRNIDTKERSREEKTYFAPPVIKNSINVWKCETKK